MTATKELSGSHPTSKPKTLLSLSPCFQIIFLKPTFGMKQIRPRIRNNPFNDSVVDKKLTRQDLNNLKRFLRQALENLELPEMQKLVGPIAALVTCISSSAGGIEFGSPLLDFEQQIAEFHSIHDSRAHNPCEGVVSQHHFPLLADREIPWPTLTEKQHHLPLQIEDLNCGSLPPVLLVEDTEDLWRFYEELIRRKNQELA